MLCGECGEREATIHELVIIAGKAIEKHLCEECAAAAGLGAGSHVPLEQLVSSFVKNPGAAIEAASELACPYCTLSYARFKQTGLLGCAGCYKAFEEKIGPLIERAHGGATHHVGKIPRGAMARSREGGMERLESLLGSMEERVRRMNELRKQLADAVQAEQYERAASLRDEIRKLSEMESPPASLGE
ncbi:MAG: UvrB/UvrC motif-containing protein [Phycisphaeraceae bacterium]|nr:UvrB/UvrC motif-containing protein [Phycisphaeraceae bacterium]MCW5764200.1 UvrB/UvrC motif-containing protein [Phycisphaeraceae bacterium]